MSYSEPSLCRVYPIHPGAKERGGTSEQAAEEVAAVASNLRQAVVQVLSEVGEATADEIAEHLHESVLAIRPRCSELVAMGRVQKLARTRSNRSGKQARVLALAEGGGDE